MSADFWDDCPAVERGPDGRPFFKGTPIPLATLFVFVANDMTAADFLDTVPRHVTGEQVDAVLVWLIERCGERVEVER